MLYRTLIFGVNCLKFLKTLPSSYELNVIKVQLSKSSTSIGANYEESQAGSSKADFRNKIRISLREARETNYWLRIIKELEVSDEEHLTKLLKESFEIKNILGAILKKRNWIKGEKLFLFTFILISYYRYDST